MAEAKTNWDVFKDGLTAEAFLATINGCSLEDSCEYCPANEFCHTKAYDLSCEKAFAAWAKSST